MGLGAVNAAPCVHGRRSARGAVNKRHCNHRPICSVDERGEQTLVAIPARDYQEHINARIRYADPDADARTRLAEEMEQEEEEAEQALVRLYNEAYLQRMGRPQEFGV